MWQKIKDFVSDLKSSPYLIIMTICGVIIFSMVVLTIIVYSCSEPIPEPKPVEDVCQVYKESYQNEVKANVERQKVIIDDYNRKIADIEQRYAAEKAELQKKTEEYVDKIVNENSKPDEMAKYIKELYGLCKDHK